VPARRPRRALAAPLGLALLTALATGCAPAGPSGPVPSPTEHLGGQPAPDVTGVVALGTPGSPALTAASDGYYEGMALRGATGDPSVLGADGAQASTADLRAGDAVEVWLRPGSACAESAPVQCDVLTVRVTAAAGGSPTEPAGTATPTAGAAG